ncbi:MAG TPA: hypothetical protein PLW81_13110 [Thiobacillaceae bacterium]|nr:hypothetical protein [Thiobacillaceae bacterium]
MIGFVVKVVVVIVVGVLAYNYFFGTVEEQAQSAKVFAQMKEVAVSVGQLARAEKEKFDAGKYDAALDKLAGVYRTAREGAKRLDAGLQKRIGDLEKREGELRAEIEEIDAAEKTADQGPDAGRKRAEQQARKARLHKEMERLIRDSENLLKEVEPG